jgi:hypothetical protein
MIEHPPAHIDVKTWHRCIPHLQGALRYANGTHEIEDVLADIANNYATLWPYERSALVTQIVSYPRKKHFNFWLAGGDMKELLSHEAGIREWAKAQGCEAMNCIGRPGWQRVLGRLGYRPSYYIVTRDI